MRGRERSHFKEVCKEVWEEILANNLPLDIRTMDEKDGKKSGVGA